MMSMPGRPGKCRGAFVLTGMLLVAGAGEARAASPAASACPTQFFLSEQLAQDPRFEVAGPNGDATCWSQGDPGTAFSAAEGWLMHTSNDQDTVCSRLAPRPAPGPAGGRLLLFRAGGMRAACTRRWTFPRTRPTCSPSGCMYAKARSRSNP